MNANLVTQMSFPPGPVMVQQATPPQVPAPQPRLIAGEHSLLAIDEEIEAVLERMDEELEEEGAISEESKQRFEAFCEAFGEKVDRIGSFLGVMKARGAHCRELSQQLLSRARVADNRIERTKSMVLGYLEARGLRKLEGKAFTLRSQKNSCDSVRWTSAETIPMRFMEVSVNLNGALWESVLEALPQELRDLLRAGMKECAPIPAALQAAVKQGAEIDGVTVSRGSHLRVA